MHKKSDDLLRKPPNLVEVPPGFELENEGFADPAVKLAHVQ